MAYTLAQSGNYSYTVRISYPEYTDRTGNNGRIFFTPNRYWRLTALGRRGATRISPKTDTQRMR